jgi:hypothetical protein
MLNYLVTAEFAGAATTFALAASQEPYLGLITTLSLLACAIINFWIPLPSVEVSPAAAATLPISCAIRTVRR